ncbi:hypothetical protein LO772_32710 [Yinghuangia sp. ASG 101]|uniref:hypothetical protein n=1 Tax=Yinghuangia sp. ASG 101 TaxID=2896848 RepID=UPI001E56EDFD|nr:hypothetical protein [Yinghuangia sp. ASG 101]UGQ11493.1 hypothetical protein LO772_32710 [Yinghuangia sp. ASG 101]
MGTIRVGKPHVRPDTASTVFGTHRGNERPYKRQPGHHRDGTADARRSTGIHWRKHNVLLKIMPSIPPS